MTVSCQYAPENNRGGCITIIWWLMKVKLINCNLQDNNMLFKKDFNEMLSLGLLAIVALSLQSVKSKTTLKTKQKGTFNFSTNT